MNDPTETPVVQDPSPETGVTTTSTDEKNIATLTWIGTIFFGFIPGLIVYLVKEDNLYLKDQAKEALNWSITAFIGMIASGILMVVLVGFLTMLGLMLLNLIFCIMGAVATSSGKAFRVPFALRLIK